MITGKNAVIKFHLCKRFTGTVTPMFFLFLENMKVQGVKLIKCFNLYRRLNNAIFFLDYRDTFISALFITPFSLYTTTPFSGDLRSGDLRRWLILKSLNKGLNDSGNGLEKYL